jgi:Fic family protein
MSVLDRFGLGKSILPANATFRLTQEGREKLQSYTGTPQARILAALETCGTSDRDEIANASGLSRGSVERNILALLQKGYIQRAGGGGGLGSDGGQLYGMGGDG